MNGLANLAWAVMCIALGLYFLVYLIAEHAAVRRRARQAFRLIAAAGPCFVAAALSWACRGRSPSRAHPASRALPCDCTACTAELSPVDFAEFERDVRAGRKS